MIPWLKSLFVKPRFKPGDRVEARWWCEWGMAIIRGDVVKSDKKVTVVKVPTGELRHCWTYEVKHEGQGALQKDYTMTNNTPTLPKTPPPGLLMSMAIRYDHGLGVAGYYDMDFYASSGLTHKQRLESTLSTMRQIYEEVAGHGFYKPEYEEGYARAMEEGLK